jgi:hypothetical protein
MAAKKSGTAQVIFLGLIIGVVIASCSYRDSRSKPGPTQAEQRALEQCMVQHRWDTKSLNTSRLAVRLHYERKSQGELAKYVSDYDAVKMVYCSK